MRAVSSKQVQPQLCICGVGDTSLGQRASGAQELGTYVATLWTILTLARRSLMTGWACKHPSLVIGCHGRMRRQPLPSQHVRRGVILVGCACTHLCSRAVITCVWLIL